MNRAKPFDIPKREVWEAFKSVKANQGAAGVDGQSIQDFEARLAGNLYKLWNRLSSGSYYAATGAPGGHPEGERRDAAVGYSHGCRPHCTRGCSPISGAVAGTGVPCGLLWLSARALGDRCGSDSASAMLAVRLDPRHRHQGFFDSIDHELLLRAVRKHTQCPWVLLYIERWLKAPVMMEDGNLCSGIRERRKGE